MTAPVAMIGRRFGRLVVIREIENWRLSSGVKQRRFVLRCDCGNETEATRANLRSGKTNSCGCSKFKHGDTTHTQGRKTVSPEWDAWHSMKQRCENPKHAAYKNYGGRGISVCQRWRDDFSAFLADVGRRPSAAHSIDRINNDGNYEPGNVRWATRKVQRANQRPKVK